MAESFKIAGDASLGLVIDKPRAIIGLSVGKEKRRGLGKILVVCGSDATDLIVSRLRQDWRNGRQTVVVSDHSERVGRTIYVVGSRKAQ